MDNNQQQPPVQPTQPLQPPVENAVQTPAPQMQEPMMQPTASPEAQQTSPAATPEQPMPAAPVQTPSAIMPAGSNHNRQLMIIAGVLVLVVVAVSGFFVAAQRTNRIQKLGMEQVRPTVLPTVAPTPVLLPEEKELESIDTGDPTQDLTDIDQTLNQIQ